MAKQAEYLLEQLQRQRTVRVEIGTRVLLAQRPDDLQMHLINRADGEERLRRLFGCFYGWEGFIEDDILGNKHDTPIDFDAKVFERWALDHSEHWEPMADGLTKAWAEHAAKKEQAAKN